MNHLYLLAGNGSIKDWWKYTLPHFKKKTPIPIELPGFGDNTSEQYQSLYQLAKALISQTHPGQEIFAVGVNGLVVLHALVLKPDHFSKVSLLAPVGAFLWQRSFVKLMRIRPIRRIIYLLLSHYPKIFKRKFSSQTWTKEQYQLIGKGYRSCRAFQIYFDIVRPHDALDFFDRIETSITLIWGTRDAVLDIGQAAAWDSILPRADLSIIINKEWGHYPYIDDPVDFAAYLENKQLSFQAHSKAGRLTLAKWSGLQVPSFVRVEDIKEWSSYAQTFSPDKLYAIRSSGQEEDQIDSSQAGLHTSYIHVVFQDISTILKTMLDSGMQEVIIQEFIQPKISGVAFVRHISAEIECVEGHLEDLLQGKVQGERCILSRMGRAWEIPPSQSMIQWFDTHGLSIKSLQAFLNKCIRVFHYQQADIEWAWDGESLYLLQFRPVTYYTWRRCITSANLDEILPSSVSMLMEHMQRYASPYIGNIMGLWDTNVFNDNEPFTVQYEDASYINSDLWLARFNDWGLPSSIYAKEIGGNVPFIPFRLWKFIRHIPVFLRMTWISRRVMLTIPQLLNQFEQEFEHIIAKEDDPDHIIPQLVRWMERYYLFIVRSNIVINTAISSTFGNFLGKMHSVYRNIDHIQAPHRLPFESDPGTLRSEVPIPPITPFPLWSATIKICHVLGVPGMVDKYIEVREWFRDNNMKLFFRIHQQLTGSNWLTLHENARTKTGTFWQDGSDVIQQSFSFVIYPGEAEGILGEDILIVDALEPGHYQDYKAAKAIISKTGGRLSHGATLLRELKKPSVVKPEINMNWVGKRVKFQDGEVILL